MKFERSHWVLTGAILLIALTVATLIIKNYSISQRTPGTGPYAEQGFAIAEKLTAGIERFKTERGKYPERLNELVPAYIEENPQKNITSRVKFSYFSGAANDSYLLRFSYETSLGGTDECSYSSEEKKWNCAGKY